MLWGIVAGLTTCALWGLSFIAPRAIEPFTVWDLTVARYGIFGLLCVALTLMPRFRPSGIAKSDVLIGLTLGGAGYVGYFILVSFAVNYAGASIPPIIIGTMPVILALIGNSKDHAVPWRAMSFPIFLIFAGVTVVNLSAFQADHVEPGKLIFGVAASTAALCIWVIYGMVNASIMRKPNAPDSFKWTGLQGIGAALVSLAIIPLTSFWSYDSLSVMTFDLYKFIAWALVMGIAGSWIATLCWVIASRRLPLALAAQLIVAETLFALLYGFLLEGRLPTVIEASGAIMQITGVCLSIALFSRGDKFLHARDMT